MRPYRYELRLSQLVNHIQFIRESKSIDHFEVDFETGVQGLISKSDPKLILKAFNK